MEIKKWKERFIEQSGIPKDVFFDIPIITIIGQTELRIENLTNILEYTEEFLRVQTKCGQIRITGRKLHISNYGIDEMKVTGFLYAIEYRQRGETPSC